VADLVEPIGAGSNPYSIDDAWDIGEALSRLALSGDPLSLYPDSGAAPQVARVLSVDDEQAVFTLELNAGTALAGGAVTCVAWLDKVKLQFTLPAAQQCGAEAHAATDAERHRPLPFPAACMVQERRHAARLDTPLGSLYAASFVADGRPFELHLYDFSLGGVGMRAAADDAGCLQVGRQLPRVRLELGAGNVLVVDLEIRLRRSFRSFLAGRQVQLGCQFIDVTPQQRDALHRISAALEQRSGAT
jgi:c-di-GMP-binding flagellar brake protein YcgR